MRHGKRASCPFGTHGRALTGAVRARRRLATIDAGRRSAARRARIWNARSPAAGVSRDHGIRWRHATSALRACGALGESSRALTRHRHAHSIAPTAAVSDQVFARCNRVRSISAMASLRPSCWPIGPLRSDGVALMTFAATPLAWRPDRAGPHGHRRRCSARLDFQSIRNILHSSASADALADASAIAVERREALGPTSLGPRTPKAATPGNRGPAVSARTGRSQGPV